MKTNLNFSFQNKEDSKLFSVHLELEAIFEIQMLIGLWKNGASALGARWCIGTWSKTVCPHMMIN